MIPIRASRAKRNKGMHAATNESALAAAVDFTRHVAELWDRRLGQRHAGVYLIGSLAHGGYSARYSDIDVALITEQPLASGELDLVHEKAVAYSAAFAAKLSLFWTDQTFSSGRFPLLDRIDYLDHAVALIERRRVSPSRPSLAEVRAYLDAEPFRRWSQEVARLSALDELPTADHKRYLRALLYPARFLYSWETGRVTSNDAAVAFVQDRALASSEVDIIVRALRCRNEGRDPLRLFSERSRLPRLLGICKERIAAAS